jgi:hypothetical protein
MKSHNNAASQMESLQNLTWLGTFSIVFVIIENCFPWKDLLVKGITRAVPKMQQLLVSILIPWWRLTGEGCGQQLGILRTGRGATRRDLFALPLHSRFLPPPPPSAFHRFPSKLSLYFLLDLTACCKLVYTVAAILNHFIVCLKELCHQFRIGQSGIIR